MAPGNPQDRQPDAFGGAVFIQGLDGVMGTGGVKPARTAGKGGKIPLIDPDQENEDLPEHHSLISAAAGHSSIPAGPYPGQACRLPAGQ